MGQKYLEPIDLVTDIAKLLPTGSVMEFSRYVYVSQTVFDDRTIIRIPAAEVTHGKLKEEYATLRPNEELAIHSRIIRGGKVVGHIPMIDFADGFEFTKESVQLCSHIIPSKIADELNIFSSGRSYHGYSFTIIDSRQWRAFNGRLLLLNMPSKHAIADSRWIGHRLIAGYSSLRLTNFSGKYLQTPSFFKYFRYL